MYKGSLKPKLPASERPVVRATSTSVHPPFTTTQLSTSSLITKLKRVPETLSEDVLAKMHAPPKPHDIEVLHDPKILEQYDAFLFGIPTRYGNFPAQWKTFWDKTGGQWQSGALWGKYAGVFVSTATPGGGQESTVISAMSTLAHHGIIYVP
ncbi:flavodoxin-like fold protein, partial [Elasticomyces elasticus]